LTATADSQRQTGAVLLAAGILLVWLAWRWHGGGGLAAVQAAVAGPLSAALGLGLLIHGERIPRYGLTRRTRAYGLIGGLAGGAYLALVGVSAGWPPIGARWLLVLFATGIWLIPVPPVAEAGGGATRDSTEPGPPG
jgi:hypothetical protein